MGKRVLSEHDGVGSRFNTIDLQSFNLLRQLAGITAESDGILTSRAVYGHIVCGGGTAYCVAIAELPQDQMAENALSCGWEYDPVPAYGIRGTGYTLP